MPVREHIQCFLPPSKVLIQSLHKHFYALLRVYQKHIGEVPLQPVVTQLTLNLGNLHEILQWSLSDSTSDVTDAVYCTLSLNSFL
jgi:hypothetical protein